MTGAAMSIERREEKHLRELLDEIRSQLWLWKSLHIVLFAIPNVPRLMDRHS